MCKYRHMCVHMCMYTFVHMCVELDDQRSSSGVSHWVQSILLVFLCFWYVYVCVSTCICMSVCVGVYVRHMCACMCTYMCRCVSQRLMSGILLTFSPCLLSQGHALNLEFSGSASQAGWFSPGILCRFLQSAEITGSLPQMLGVLHE